MIVVLLRSCMLGASISKLFGLIASTTGRGPATTPDVTDGGGGLAPNTLMVLVFGLAMAIALGLCAYFGSWMEPLKDDDIIPVNMEQDEAIELAYNTASLHNLGTASAGSS